MMTPAERKSFERKFNVIYGAVCLAIVSGVLAATGGLHWQSVAFHRSFALVAVSIGVWSWWG